MTDSSEMFVLLLKKGLLIPGRYKYVFDPLQRSVSSEIAKWPDDKQRDIKILGHYSDIEIRYIPTEYTIRPLVQLWNDTCQRAIYSSAQNDQVQPILIFSNHSTKSITQMLKSYPFFLISFITINPDILYSNDKNQIRNVISAIDKDLCERLASLHIKGEAKICYSLDCADRVAFIGTNDPSLALDRIYSLQTVLNDDFDTIMGEEKPRQRDSNKTKRRYSYTYSIIGMNVHKESVFFAYKPEIPSTKNHANTISRISVTGIIDCFAGYKEWLSLIRNDVAKHTKIQPHVQAGGHDVFLQIDRVSIKTFYNWMKPQGLFSRDNPINMSAFARFSLRISAPFSSALEDTINGINSEDEKRTIATADSFKYHKEKFLNPWEDVLKVLVHSRLQKEPDVIRVLFSLFASMKQAGLSDSTFGLFCSVAPAIDEFFKGIKREILFSDNSIIEIKKDVYKVVQHVNNLVESVTHSHRHQFETPDLQAKNYDIYSKLFSIYVGFCSSHSSLLKAIAPSAWRNYSFLLSPALSEKMSVEVILGNPETGGIILISAPERVMYRPDIMIPQLIHEINHPFGTVLGMPKGLSVAYNNVLVRICADQIVCLPSSANNDIDYENLDGVFDVFNARIYKKIYEYLYYETERRIDINNISSSPNSLLPRDIRNSLKKSFERTLDKLRNEFSFIQLLDDDQLSAENVNILLKYENFLHKNVDFVCNHLGEIIESSFKLIDESLADIVMCSTLKLTVNEYICLYSDFSPNDSEMRFSEQFKALQVSFSHNLYENDAVRIIAVSRVMWPDDYKSNDFCKNLERSLALRNIDSDNEVLKSVDDYLCFCKEEFRKNLLITNARLRHDDLVKSYKLICKLNNHESSTTDFAFNFQELLCSIISSLRYPD